MSANANANETAAAADVRRHFTATGFVVRDGCVALHWHPKVKAWLPPGGHIEPNEDPVQAVKRETLEETGIAVEVAPTSSAPNLGVEYPRQVAPPYAIMVEDIHDPVEGFHQHIDMIYFCRPQDAAAASADLPDGWRWVSRESLSKRRPLPNANGAAEPPPEDVCRLGMAAVEWVGGRAILREK